MFTNTTRVWQFEPLFDQYEHIPAEWDEDSEEFFKTVPIYEELGNEDVAEAFSWPAYCPDDFSNLSEVEDRGQAVESFVETEPIRGLGFLTERQLAIFERLQDADFFVLEFVVHTPELVRAVLIDPDSGTEFEVTVR